MDMTTKIVLYSVAKRGFLKGFAARRTRDDAELACIVTGNPYEDGVLSFVNTESLDVTLGAFAALTGSRQLVDEWMPLLRPDRPAETGDSAAKGE